VQTNQIFPMPMSIQDPSQAALVIKYNNKNQELTQFYEELPQIKGNLVSGNSMVLRESHQGMDP